MTHHAHVHASERPGGPDTSRSARDAPRFGSREVRQGRRGSRIFMVLAVSLILAITAFVVIGMFSDTLLLTDVTAPDEAPVVPGPTEAQEPLIDAD